MCSSLLELAFMLLTLISRFMFISACEETEVVFPSANYK